MNKLTPGRYKGFPRRPVRPGAMVHARQLARITGPEAARLLSWRRRRKVMPGRIYAWEKGDDRPPEWAVETLARIYGVEAESLFEKNLPIRRKAADTYDPDAYENGPPEVVE